MKDNTIIIIRTRGIVFAGMPARNYEAHVGVDEIHVFDNVAGHMTTCHSIPPRAQSRLFRQAREERRRLARA